MADDRDPPGRDDDGWGEVDDGQEDDWGRLYGHDSWAAATGAGTGMPSDVWAGQPATKPRPPRSAGQIIGRALLYGAVVGLVLGGAVAAMIVFGGEPQVGDIPVVMDPGDGKRHDGEVWWRADVTVVAGRAVNMTGELGSDDCDHDAHAETFTVATGTAQWNVTWDPSRVVISNLECVEYDAGAVVHLMGATTKEGEHLVRGIAPTGKDLAAADWLFPLLLGGPVGLVSFLFTTGIAAVVGFVRR